MKICFALWSLVLIGTETEAFVREIPAARLQFTVSPSCLFGINEWREQALENINSRSTYDTQETKVTDYVPIYLMDSKRVALPGETVYLQFTENDDVRIFQQAIDYKQGIFGLGFVSSEDDVLYDKVSLVEIKEYNMMGDRFGVFLSCQVVGNAMILETNLNSIRHDESKQSEPVIALCSEVTSPVETMKLADASSLGRKVETLIAHVHMAEKERRLQADNEDDDDDDDNRWSRYHAAYKAIFQSDSHGYTYTNEESTASEKGSSTMYTWKQLNAISWAVFSTSQSLQQDYLYRLAALDNDYMTNRLLFASYWLVDVLKDIENGTV